LRITGIGNRTVQEQNGEDREEGFHQMDAAPHLSYQIRTFSSRKAVGDFLAVRPASRLTKVRLRAL